MFTDIVNKITFDFTCKDEGVAKNVQREIEIYTAPEVNIIIEKALEQTGSEDVRQIDKIEIDLGDIYLEDISTSVVNKFIKLFDEHLAKAPHTLYKNLERIDSYFKPGRTNGEFATIPNGDMPVMLAEAQFEIIKEYLLYGELPWWIDKTDLPDLNKVLKDLLKAQPEAVSLLLKQLTKNKQASQRLWNQFTIGTHNLIAATIPGFGYEYYFEIAGFTLYNEHKPGLYPQGNVNRNAISITGKNALTIEKHSTINPSRLLEEQLSGTNNVTQNYLLKERLKVLQDNLEDAFLSPYNTTLKTALAESQVKPADLNNIENKSIHLTDLTGPPKTKSGTNKKTIEADLGERENDQLLTTDGVSENILSGTTVTKHHQVGNQNTLKDQLLLKNTFIASLKKLINAFKYSKNEESDLKKLLLNQLFQIPDAQLKHKLTILNFLDRRVLLKLNPSISKYNDGTIKREAIVNILQKRSLPEIEFLIHNTLIQNREVLNTGTGENLQESNLHDQLEEAKSTSEKNQAKGEREIRSKRIALILKILQNVNDALLSELETYSSEDLIYFEKVLKKSNQTNGIKKKLIAYLVRHQYFLQYNLLQLPVKLLADMAQEVEPGSGLSLLNKQFLKELKKYETELTLLLKRMSADNRVITKDILTKKAFGNNFELNVLITLLQKLPLSSIRLAAQFCQLNEVELKVLVNHNNPLLQFEPPENVDVKKAFFNNDVPKKTVINNAGLCLLAPYIPRLFNNLGYIENKDFKSKIHRFKALSLLQYLAFGSSIYPEYVLQFNKLLCGLQTTDVITLHRRLTKSEKIEADELLTSVVSNWKLLNGTSINGLRTSFLQRNGLLFENEKFWTLQVEKKGYDVLIDSVPWSFNIIKLPWMNKSLQVEW